MKTKVEFRSSEFAAIPGEEKEVGAGRWGKALAQFLAKELAAHKFDSTGIVAEKGNWKVNLRNEEFPLSVGCRNYDEYPDGFLVFIEPSKPVIKRWFRDIETHQTVDALAAAIEAILRPHPGVRDFFWWPSETLGG